VRSARIDADDVIDQSPVDINKHELLIVIQSGSQFYNTRLQYINDTWASDVPRDQLIVIGDDVPPMDLDLKMTIEPERCSKTHGEGGCCKFADSVLQAHERMRQYPSLKWVYFGDDDIYLRVARLQEALSKEDPKGFWNKTEKNGTISHGGGTGIVLARIGCFTPRCGNGICGGGGWAASREAIVSLVGGHTSESFHDEMQAKCLSCSKWADLAMSEVLNDRKITKKAMDGLYYNLNEKPDFVKTLDGTWADPLMYHHIREEPNFKFLHGLFSCGPVSTGPDADCVTYKHRKNCLSPGEHVPHPRFWP